MIYITYSNKSQLEKLGDISKYHNSFKLIDSLSKSGKKESWKLKNYWGAKLDPFVFIEKHKKPIKVFYSEAEDTIDSLIKYLNNNGK